jgi:hypothetical protein
LGERLGLWASFGNAYDANRICLMSSKLKISKLCCFLVVRDLKRLPKYMLDNNLTPNRLILDWIRETTHAHFANRVACFFTDYKAPDLEAAWKRNYILGIVVAACLCCVFLTIVIIMKCYYKNKPYKGIREDR